MEEYCEHCWIGTLKVVKASECKEAYKVIEKTTLIKDIKCKMDFMKFFMDKTTSSKVATRMEESVKWLKVELAKLT